jgi:hypothetical protein
LKDDGDTIDYLPFEVLPEGMVVVSYQILGMQPATSVDDP